MSMSTARRWTTTGVAAPVLAGLFAITGLLAHPAPTAVADPADRVVAVGGSAFAEQPNPGCPDPNNCPGPGPHGPMGPGMTGPHGPMGPGQHNPGMTGPNGPMGPGMMGPNGRMGS